ncbi:type 4a pilus biogenesis protein PilO [Candidatus Daviesbacteria bacterium]|nr:type 4a pilus biogenesis protein PilO [Candidatus Daviesbacteria bacterium]
MRSQSQIYSRYFTYIKPITKSPIIRTYGSTVFTLIIITIFIFFAIKPTIETIVVLQKKLADSNEVLKKVNQKANNLSLGKANLEKLPADIKSKISAAIPDTASLKSVIQSLEKTAKAHNASVSALQFQPLVLETKIENQLGKLSEVSFTFNAEGEYQNLVLLLRDLRDSARLIAIDSLTFSKLSSGNGLIMSITGKAYYLK